MSAQTNGKAEARGMWVVRTDVTSPEKIKQAIKYAKDNNFNFLIVQVRGRGDAFYNSHFEPRAESLADQPADFDPLAMYLKEGRKAGIQIHAWLNTHYSWSSAQLPKSPEHVVNKHPEWLMRTIENKVTFTGGPESEGAYTCPSNPEVKEHVKSCFLDVVKNYDVAGVNFDFVRYPSPEYCYCDACLSRFKARVDKELSPEKIAELSASKERLAYPQALPEKYDQFRRDQITDLVSRIYREAHEIKPEIIVSADTFPAYEDANNRRFQDWKLWLKMGILDLLCPMAYAQETETWATHVRDAVENSNGRPVYAGIGQWRISLESTIEKVRKAREIGADGICLFAYGSATKDGTTDEVLAGMKAAVFQTPAPMPSIRGK